AWVDLYTEQFLAADSLGEQLRYVLGRLAPSECLCPDNTPDACLQSLQEHHAGMVVCRRPDWTFDPLTARAALLKHFNIQTLGGFGLDRKSTRLNSSHQIISYAVFCLKKKI